MAITLDGSAYGVFQAKYNHPTSSPRTTRTTLTGDVDRIESGILQNRYRLTLVCTAAQITSLRASFAKVTAGTSLLNFVDEEGMNWNPSAGADDSTHRYSTGVYVMSPEINPQPVHAGGWNSKNRFTVDIELLVNAKY